MLKELLKEVVVSQSQRLNMAIELVERTQKAEVISSLKLPHAVVISGIRRSGKSTLLMNIVQENYQGEFYFLNFEDERLLNFTVGDFSVLHEVFIELYGEKKVFYFDEIQNIPDWERYVRRMQDDGYKFLLTGSNAALLSRELGTKLTGRHANYELFPFSFKEYLDFSKISYETNFQYDPKKRAVIKSAFNSYLQQGGLPEFLKYLDEKLLTSLYEDILFRDIIVRHDIKDVKALREIGLYLFSNIACRYSLNKIKNAVSLGSVNTVKNYLQYLEDAYLFFSLEKYDASVKRQIASDKKIYTIDNGLANAISFQFSKNKGHFLENLVFLQLRVQNKEMFFYQTKKNKEVDFALRENRKITQLIQVTFELSNEKTKKREIAALIEAMEETGLKEGLILTDETKDILNYEDKQIHVLPVYEWLLLKT